MSKNWFNYAIYIIIVFIQVFFLDNFEFKFGLIFVPLLIYIEKRDLNNFYFNSILLFIFYEFFKNNFVGLSLIIFLVCNFIVDQLAKLWGIELVLVVKFSLVLIIFYFFSGYLFTFNTLINLIILLILFLVRRALKSGYFRLN